MRSTGTAVLVVLAALSPLACQAPAQREDSQSYLPVSGDKLLHYRKVGRGEDVLVVPGANWVGGDMGQLTSDRTVVFYDLRGRGRSDPVEPFKPPSLEQDLADLEELREWFGLERFSMLGVDYSAALCAHYAARYPERVERLVLISPLPIRRDPYYRIYERVYNDRLDVEAFESLSEMRRKGLDRRDPRAWADAFEEALFGAMAADASSLRGAQSHPFERPNLDPERMIRQYLDLLRSFGAWDWREALAGVACPTLVVYGSADPVPTASHGEWVESLPEGLALEISGSGRLPWLERPSSFYSPVRLFLRGRP